MESLEDGLVLILAGLLTAFLPSSVLLLVLETMSCLRDGTKGWLLTVGLTHKLSDVAVLRGRMAWTRVTKSITDRSVGLVHASKLSFGNCALHVRCTHAVALWAVRGGLDVCSFLEPKVLHRDVQIEKAYMSTTAYTK